MRRILTAAFLTLVAIPLVAQADGSRRPGGDEPNIHFSLVISDIDGSGNAQEQRIESLAASGRAARLHTGWKVAIPVGRPDPQSAAPAVSYQYQDVGMSATLEGTALEDGRIRVSGRLEVSALDAARPAASAATAGLPQIVLYSHEFEAMLHAGAPTILAEAPKPGGGEVKLVLTASLER